MATPGTFSELRLVLSGVWPADPVVSLPAPSLGVPPVRPASGDLTLAAAPLAL